MSHWQVVEDAGPFHMKCDVHLLYEIFLHLYSPCVRGRFGRAWIQLRRLFGPGHVHHITAVLMFFLFLLSYSNRTRRDWTTKAGDYMACMYTPHSSTHRTFRRLQAAEGGYHGGGEGLDR